MSSDGEALLLREVDRKLGLTRQLARALGDRCRRKSCQHPVVDFLRQRVFAMAAGYEDLNDHARLRGDPLWQSAVQRDRALASASSLCRWENRAGRQTAWAMHQVFVEQFIKAFKSPPGELILDFDATDDRVHGMQEGRFFQDYYRD